MFILANLLVAVAQVASMILTILMWFIVIRALISWVNPDPYNPIVQFLYRITDPILNRIRRVIPHIMGIDFTAIIAIVIIVFLQNFVVQSLMDFSHSLK